MSEMDDWSVSAARDHVRKHASDGVLCPVCQRNYKLYKRSFNAGMAATLVWLRGYGLRKSPDRPFPWVEPQKIAPRIVVANREYPRAHFWGMLEPRTSGDEASKIAGVWRLTERGADFVDGKIETDSHMFLLNNSPIQLSPEGLIKEKVKKISIRDALGVKADFEDLFHGRV